MYSTEFQNIIDFRRSNRKFDPEITVPEEVIRKSIERAILSPNSSNMQLWEFYWIHTDEKKSVSCKNCTGDGCFCNPSRPLVKTCKMEL